MLLAVCLEERGLSRVCSKRDRKPENWRRTGFAHATMTRTTLDPVQALWIGPGLSKLEQCSIRSFLHHGHAYHLYVYDDVRGVPDGAEVRDAEAVLPRSKIFKYRSFDTYSGFSNLFRYKLLYDQGGYWSDLDVVCLQSLPSTDYVFSGERGRNGGQKLNPCILRAPPRSPLMERLYATASACDVSRLYWGQIGPKLLTDMVRDARLERYAQPYTSFCPINWWQWTDVFDPHWWVWLKLTARSRHKPIYAVHLWNEMWRRNNYDKNRAYATGSFFEYLKRRYLTRSASSTLTSQTTGASKRG